jgi:hypothetical protein
MRTALVPSLAALTIAARPALVTVMVNDIGGAPIRRRTPGG